MRYNISYLALLISITVSIGVILFWSNYIVLAHNYQASQSKYTQRYSGGVNVTKQPSGGNNIINNDHSIVGTNKNDDGSLTMITVTNNWGLPTFGSHTFPPSNNNNNNSFVPVIPPPTTTLTAQINPDTTQYQDSIFITPDDEITLEWDSTSASNCTNNFGAPESTSGTFDITPGLTPGDNIVYEVTCTGAGGNVTSDITVTTPDIIVNTFEITPRIVRSGETATFEWELELSDSLTLTDADDLTPYSYECTIQGATPDGTVYTFDAADNNGSGTLISRTLTSKYINLLQCGTAVSEEAEVEVVPSVMEI